MDDLRQWELHEIAAILKKVQRPSRDYCYFRDTSITKPKQEVKPKKWWSSIQEDVPTRWISPPRAMMEQSARDKAALCINEQGQWSLRTSGYVALSHVWIEGLQRDQENDGLSSQKVDAIFALLQSRAVQAEWIWTDVLVIPAGGGPTSALEDEMLTIDIINTMPEVYSRAHAVIIIDALVLQLYPQNHVDVAVAVACGRWATRVWTYQEIKLANRALILTATGSYDYKSIVDTLKSLEDQNYAYYHHLWLRIASMMKDEERGISIPDIVMSCVTRKSGQDVDYARAFFPVLGLKWEFGMTREEGMQQIYTSYTRHASRVACFYGAPRMSVKPAWAPSSFSGLEGYVTEPMQWENRGIRGDWYTVRVASVKKTFFNAKRFVFNMDMDCSGETYLQCACAPNEDLKVSQAYLAAVERGQCYVLSAQPSSDALKAEFARVALLVERAPVNESDGFEAAVYCAAIITSQSQHAESKQTVLLRHWSPMADGDLHNQIQYMWHTQEANHQPANLPRQEGESELHAAARSGDLSRVVELIENSESVESFDSNGWTPLHVAAARGNADILRHLLCQFPNIEIKGKEMNQDTPLSYAALNGKAESIEILLEFGANVHARNKCEYTPIMVAAFERHAEAVTMLLKGGANPNDEAGFSGSALLLASGTGTWRLPTLRALIEGGANVKPKHPHGLTPLHNIAKFGFDDEMAYLIGKGCEPDRPQWNGHTPLVIAIQKSKRECVRLLLDAGADRNRTSEETNYAPVHWAASCPNWQIMQMLLETNDVELDVPAGSERRTPLYMAYEAKNMTVVKMLLKAGADPEVGDADGRAPLHVLDLPPAGVGQMSDGGVPSPPLPPRPRVDAAAAPPLPPRQQGYGGPPPLPPRQGSGKG